MVIVMVIVKRHKGAEVEAFEISESQLQTFRVASALAQEPALAKETIDLYKMEYETCAKRYNDLYSAAWTNFSYMALFAGGVLTFGGTRFVTSLTAFLACLPLLFWWIATFEPLNRYGDDVQGDLGRTEKALNALAVSTIPSIPTDASHGLCHFQDFAGRAGKSPSDQRIVVKWAIGVLFFVLLLLIALVIFVGVELPLGSFGDLRALGAYFSFLGLVSLTLFLIYEQEARGGSGIVMALKQFRRVRFLVRATGAVLLITAICFGVRMWQLRQNNQSLIVTESRVPA
jgi:hypothetical protein